MEKKQNYAFISYSSKNQLMADSVRIIFIEKGIPCWMAPYDIPAGSKYAYVINDALENCACLVLLLTKASQESQFVEREIDRAITYNKPIIPIQLEDVQLNSGFKFYLGNSQIVSVPDIEPDSPQLSKAIASVFNIIETKDSPPCSDNESIVNHTTLTQPVWTSIEQSLDQTFLHIIEKAYQDICDYRSSVNAKNADDINKSVMHLSKTISKIWDFSERYKIARADLAEIATHIVTKYNCFVESYSQFILELQSGRSKKSDQLAALAESDFDELRFFILSCLR